MVCILGRLSADIDMSAHTTPYRPLIDQPRRSDVFDREPERSEERDLGLRGTAGVVAVHHLTDLGNHQALLDQPILDSLDVLPRFVPQRLATVGEE